MEEVWKPIEGYEGLYEVSNLGRVRSLDRVVYRSYKGHPQMGVRLMARKQGLYNTRDDGCWICHNPNAECHHIYGGVGRRPISDNEGCYVFLCKLHHNGSNFGVHFDHELDQFFKEDCERRWCAANGKTPDDFRQRFGVNYV